MRDAVPCNLKSLRWGRFSAAMTSAVLLVLAMAHEAAAQDSALDIANDLLLSERAIQLFLLVTVLSLVPGIAMMITCFPFIVTVLAILRQGIGLQTSPPNMLIVSLALFLSYYVMEPVFADAWQNGIQPLTEGRLPPADAIASALAPFRTFMAGRVAPDAFAELATLRGLSELATPSDAPLSVLVPAFLLSEIERAFQVGFLIFLPFLIIDLVVAAVLMSMGMMMVPPAIVALPFKLAFFVAADGWSLVATALVRGYLPSG